MSERVTVREYQTRPGVWVVDADFAHKLAEELAESKERIKRLEEAGNAMAVYCDDIDADNWKEAKESKP
jgi:hypothetical protein